jgi:hypothetical protein
MAGLNQNPTALSRIITAINVLGLSFTSVRSVADGVFRFVTGVIVPTPWSANTIRANTVRDRANTMELDDAMNFENFSTCIDNMNFMYPEIFSGVDSFTSFNEGLSYSAVFVSERDTCCFCNGKLATNPVGKEVIVAIRPFLSFIKGQKKSLGSLQQLPQNYKFKLYTNHM